MKRRNLIVDENLLEEARKAGGIRTFSETVNRALKEYLRSLEAERIFELEGVGLLEKRKTELKGKKHGKKGEAAS